MTREEYLAKRNSLLDAAQTAADASDMATVGAKTEEIKKLDASFEASAEAQANIAAMRDQVSQAAPLTANGITSNVVNFVGGKAVKQEEKEDIYASKGYRIAFANYVAKGVPIPAKFRNTDENTLTTDVPGVIPTTIVPRIIETMEAIGMIYPLITKTNYKTGVQIPTSSVRPVATRVAEGAGSDKKKKTVSYITFYAYKLRCEISWSMEVNEMTLGIFESTFTKQVSEAMIKKIESEILSTADGSASCKGIFAETPNSGQLLQQSELSYENLVAAEAALPEQYEGNAVWVMTKKTFMGYMGMTDANGQPIARVNYGMGGKPERTLLGRPVVTAGEYMSSFSSTLTAGAVFAAIFNFADYAYNTVYDMGIMRKQDWDTEDMLTKAVMSNDGKVVDKGSLVVIKKKA